MREWFVLEGTFKGHVVQPACLGQGSDNSVNRSSELAQYLLNAAIKGGGLFGFFF